MTYDKRLQYIQVCCYLAAAKHLKGDLYGVMWEIDRCIS